MSNAPTFDAPYGLLPHGGRATSPQEAAAWSRPREGEGRGAATKAYHPRFAGRDERVRHPSLVYMLKPGEQKRLMDAFLRIAKSSLSPAQRDALLVIEKSSMHATNSWQPPSKVSGDLEGDERIIESARTYGARLPEVVRDVPPMTLKVNGFMVRPNQIMATVEDWNPFLDSMKVVRDGIPELREGAYNPLASPLQRGQIVQVTLAGFREGGQDLTPYIDAFDPYLPKLDGTPGHDGLGGLEVDGLTFVVHEHGPAFMRAVDRLVEAPFQGRSAETGTGRRPSGNDTLS